MNQWGGYALHRPDDDGPATLTLNGARVGLVHLALDGGHHHYEFTNPQAEHAYTVFAEDLSPDALEPDDVLTDKLAVSDDLDRSPSVVFVIDEDDFFTTGRYRTYGPNVALDRVVEMLTGAHRPGGDVVPKVWVRGSGFVPVDQVTAA